MEARQLPLYADGLKKLPGFTRVFAEDEIDFAQNIDGAIGDIPHVPYRRRDEVEGGWADFGFFRLNRHAYILTHDWVDGLV